MRTVEMQTAIEIGVDRPDFSHQPLVSSISWSLTEEYPIPNGVENLD